jgi:Uncharacterized protein containing a von Willebrand factor type A (vWA) domain
MTELDTRAQLLNSFLATPHGKLADVASLHSDALKRDPLFYGHLAAWYADRGEVRDHKVLFVAHLLTSDYSELREAGWVLLQSLPVHQVASALDHAKRTIGKLPRMFKSAIKSYLQALEANPKRFDTVALRSRNDLKHLYASLRIAPNPRAQAILFDETPPEDSRLYMLKQIARCQDPAEQARLIVELRIPYPIAASVIKSMTPSVLVALVEVMTPQELVNHLASLKKHGAFDHPELKQMIEEKIKAVESDKRVSTLKAKRALEHVELDEQTTALLTEVTDKRVANIARIDRSVALLVDKSGSMTRAIEVGKQVAALVSAICSDFRAFAFDTVSFEIKAEGDSLSAWEKAFSMIKADGGTSIGAPLAELTREGYPVEQIVIVTDLGDNTEPLFHKAYQEYVNKLGLLPNVTVVTVDTHPGLLQQILNVWQAAGVPYVVWEFKGDYYSLPNLLPLLTLPDRRELARQVMEVPLPRRQAV